MIWSYLLEPRVSIFFCFSLLRMRILLKKNFHLVLPPATMNRCTHVVSIYLYKYIHFYIWTHQAKQYESLANAAHPPLENITTRKKWSYFLANQPLSFFRRVVKSWKSISRDPFSIFPRENPVKKYKNRSGRTTARRRRYNIIIIS